MHPNTYLKTFWRLDFQPRVFVAMSFAARYQKRFEEVITPAIRSITHYGKRLEPYRVDISKSGDSILTDISDGIAHSRLVLADVSSVGKDSVTGDAFRNANVMYEIGIALACRQPSDVLLVRDDHDKFLFDVSTIPHITLDFTNKTTAISVLQEQLVARLNEQDFVHDARVQIAIHSLSAEEIVLLKQMHAYDLTTIWGREVKALANWYSLATSRLLDKGVIRLVGEFEGEKGKPAFAFTPFGYEVHQAVNKGLEKFKPSMPKAVIDEIPSAKVAPDSSSAN
jgi:hypothetical protein